MPLPARHQIFVHPFLTSLTTKAAFPIAAKTGCRIEYVSRVNPDDAGLQLRRHIERQVYVLGPNRCSQAIDRIVRQRNRLGGRPKLPAHHDWDKDFERPELVL